MTGTPLRLFPLLFVIAACASQTVESKSGSPSYVSTPDVPAAQSAAERPSSQPRPDSPAFQAVELRNSAVAGPGARYDIDAGVCSAGSVQFVTREQFDTLRKEWMPPRAGRTCTDSQKQQIPETTGYPARFVELGKSGSAHVLVRIEADGSVASAHAVCATDEAFGNAAVATALAIRYTPRVCDGAPERNVFMLPFQYHWD